MYSDPPVTRGLDYGHCPEEAALRRSKQAPLAAQQPWVVSVESYGMGHSIYRLISLMPTIEEWPTVGDLLSGLVAAALRQPEELPFLALLHDGIPVVSMYSPVTVQQDDTLTIILREPEDRAECEAVTQHLVEYLDLQLDRGPRFRLEIRYVPVLSIFKASFPQRRAPLDELLILRPSESVIKLCMITWLDTTYHAWCLSSEPAFRLRQQGIRPHELEKDTRMILLVERASTEGNTLAVEGWGPEILRGELVS